MLWIRNDTCLPAHVERPARSGTQCVVGWERWSSFDRIADWCCVYKRLAFPRLWPRSRAEGFDEFLEVDRPPVCSAPANATARQAGLERASAVSRPTAATTLGECGRQSMPPQVRARARKLSAIRLRYAYGENQAKKNLIIIQSINFDSSHLISFVSRNAVTARWPRPDRTHILGAWARRVLAFVRPPGPGAHPLR